MQKDSCQAVLAGCKAGHECEEWIVLQERPVTKECVTYVQERHPVAKQYVVETHFTGEEREMAGAAQQQVVGHKERYISGVPVNYGNNDLYM